MNPTRNSMKRLAAVLVGTSALMLVGTVAAQRPERRVTPDQSQQTANPNARALKTQADEAKAVTIRIEKMVDAVDKEVQSLEGLTDKIEGKSDLSALANASKKVEQLKTMVAKLETESEALRKVATQMDREIGKLKK